MKFAIFREFIQEGKQKRKVYIEWPKEKIEKELSKELGLDVSKALNNIIEKFKKNSIRIP